MDILQDLLGYMRIRKKYWLMPLIVTLLTLGGLLIATSGTAIAPFIYTLF